MPKPKRGTDVSEFLARTERLDRAVGRGKLVMGITVDQRYAKYQHERTDLIHWAGGNDHYLTGPLYERMADMMTGLARAAITPQGSDLIARARREVEGWAAASAAQTPRWFVDLARSHAPWITDDGRTVYRRPPQVPRLTDDELRTKNRAPHPSRERGRRR